MTEVSTGGSRSPETSLAIEVRRARGVSWWRTPTARRYTFGYTLLAPAVLYVLLLVGAPFLFSLYLALSDASTGAPVAHFVGLVNFRSAVESSDFYSSLLTTLLFTVCDALSP